MVWDANRYNVNISAKESTGHCEAKHKKRGLMGNVQNWLIERSKLNYSGCKTQVWRMKTT
jgi:hypothetical protein